ncbi:MAG TPA: DUF4139 domain-containing protein [Acetobacteraceae bacterium]
MRSFPLVLLASVVLPLPAMAGDLELKRLMLSSGGVGYVEYQAAVDGPATLGLDVPLAQVDDLLKSLVVFDSAGGVGGIELPGRDGTNAAFGDVPFGPDALDSPLAYLNSLQGVVLQVAGPQAMTGRLLKAETVRENARADQPDSGTPRTRVSLLTDSGLRQFVLEDADSVQVADPALREKIAQALAALRRDSSQTMRHITLRDSGTGQRTIRVGYVAAMALWKTSYRLILPEEAGGKARLQGWAVLENATGADWNGVQLALQYGNPVTLHQAIYRSYFVQLPDVPVEVLGRLLPDVDTRATAMAALATPGEAAPKALRGLAAPAPSAAPAMTAPMAPATEEANAAEGADDTVFGLSTPVVLAAGHTASVPILDRMVTAERIGLVQLGRPHPLAAVKLTNDTASSLPAGILTLYDPASPAAFAGDARLGGLPAGESRLLSFAEDLRTGVTWKIDQATSIAALTAAAGVLHIDQRQRWTAHIGLAAPAAEPRNLLVEIPKSLGSDLVTDDGGKPSEQTATGWRQAISLKPGETHDLVVHVDRMIHEQTVLMQDDRVLAGLLGDQSLTGPARAVLQHIADLRAAEAAHVAERDRLNAQVADADRDEYRIRQNLAVVPPNDALHARLVRQIEANEDKIAALGTSIDQANTAADQAHQALAAAVRELKL